MTSSQEPPLTRRELRERERLREQQAEQSTPADASAPKFPVSPAPGPQSAPPAYPGAPAPMPQPPAPQQAQLPQQAPVGRPSPAAQPLPVPQQAQAAPAQVPQQTQAPQQGTPGFSPRSAGAATTAHGSPFGGSLTAAPPPVVPQQAPPAPAAQPVPRPMPPQPQEQPAFVPRDAPQPWSRQEAQAPRPAPVSDDEETPERTLTRRELRALIDAHQGDADDDLGDGEAGAPRPAQPAPVAAAAPQQVRPAPQPTAAPHAPVRAPAPHQTTEAVLADQPAAAAKPVGHWTSQLDLPEDRPEPYDQLLSRGGAVSHGVPTTTNALILPNLPDQGPLGQPLPDGGEIIVTGSIDLPRSFGATGAHPSHIDSSDVDRLFDQVEDTAGTGAAPVAATRAISTQGPARTMLTPPKKEGMNAPLVLAVTAGVLALGVVATLVIGAVLGLF
ncbi:hypothetical protein ABIQ69_08215 [Agromyces sp. G08B096]|uniref:Uncharacterized protein n=1 Tax=Agromyces sp. G08B096 TaxID=3156399 RepID=A0AAU7WCZ2_9MICO